MRWGAAAALLAGLALTGWLVASHGLSGILALLHQAGWGIPLVVALHGVQLLASAEAWRAVAGPLRRCHGRVGFLALRWIREGVNTMLPVAQIGGEVVGARLLHRRGMPLPTAIAASAGDVGVGLLTQAVFTLVGLGVLAALAGRSDTAFWFLAGTCGVLAVGAALGIGLRLGLAQPLERWVRRLSARLGWPGSGPGLDAAFRALGRDRAGLLRCGLLHVASWVAGGAEVWLALHVLGAQAGYPESLAIEALGQAIRTAGFAIPGAVGVAEGGLVLVCGLFGLPADLAIALALLKRLRDVAFGLPALVAWQVLEARPAPAPAERTPA